MFFMAIKIKLLAKAHNKALCINFYTRAITYRCNARGHTSHVFTQSRFIMEYSFNVYNSLAPSGATIALKKLLRDLPSPPVIVCVGSDLSVGDSLGPIVGTKLKEKLCGANVFVYGTLAKPITAHEVKYMTEFISSTHPDSKVIAVDAAVGVSGDIGLIKLSGKPLRPGSGANKRLNKIGDVSVLGIVAEKSVFNYSLFSATRLNFVYKMSEVVAEAISSYVLEQLQNLSLCAESKKAIDAFGR